MNIIRYTKFFIIPVLFVIGYFAMMHQLAFSSGITISSCEELQLIGSDPVEYPSNESYSLTQNIDCSDTINCNSSIFREIIW
jgi:hypothetical protein